MKRQDNVKKLLKEGFSEKTLVNFSDKQLEKLAGMIVSETLNIQKDDKQAIDKAKMEKKQFDTYEEDVAEEKPSAGLTKKEKSAVVKKAKKGGDIGKKGKNFKDVVAKAKKSGAKDPEAVAGAAMWKNIKEGDVNETKDFMKKQHINKGFEVVGKKGKKNKSIVEWVDEIANKKYTSLTLKREIMEMVTTKVDAHEEGKKVKKGHNGIPEFMSYDAIKDTQTAEPITKPKEPITKPGTRPRPKTPYQPGPGTNPRPKAMGDNRLK